MYSKFQLSLRYLGYYFSASNGKGHGMHSPFVFEFISSVLNDKTIYPAYFEVEKLRTQLLQDQSEITIEDWGAGSVTSKSNQRTVASIAKNAAKPAKYGQLLFRIIKYYQPQNMLELGTSLGITTAYLSLANPLASLVTLEGAHALVTLGRQNLASLDISNVEIIQGQFDENLPGVIKETKEAKEYSSVDFAFVDGNHRYEPTVKYFYQLLSVRNNQSIFVFDDIHWSREMEQAWDLIKNHPEVMCSIDLFFIGIVIFRKEFKEKQNFCIRF